MTSERAETAVADGDALMAENIADHVSLSCPACGKSTCLAHVERDRIARWSCETCGYEWLRGCWDPPTPTETEGLVIPDA